MMAVGIAFMLIGGFVFGIAPIRFDKDFQAYGAFVALVGVAHVAASVCVWAWRAMP